MSVLIKKISTFRRVARSQGMAGIQSVVRQKMDSKPLVQYARLAPSAIPAIMRYGLPDVFVYFLGGIGDDLLLTVMFRELRLRHRPKLWAMSWYPDVFRHNHDVDLVVPQRPRYERLMKRLKVKIVTPWYSNYHPAYDRDDPYPEQHIISIMCQKAGILGSITLKPYLSLQESERKGGQLVRRQVAIQSGGLTARHAMTNKNWFAERYQSLVSTLSHKYDFVQLGSSSDPPLDGALDLRGKTGIRESAAILDRSLAFVGQVGFLMHLARAVDCRSVILYGGREKPSQSGYTCNENLYREVGCSPCWRLNSCPYERECMRRISTRDAIDALERQVERYGTPLACDTDTITQEQIDRTALRYADAVQTHRRAWALIEDGLEQSPLLTT
ncbi:MAG TPA: glycosyltransferase family 9 protein [Marisediminicola sp.]|jgi:ADP-heptose:LPS heptosyltransferase|nr:glycosyltransferase family 9 protein [Marisediminicola sp.]